MELKQVHIDLDKCKLLSLNRTFMELKRKYH